MRTLIRLELSVVVMTDTPQPESVPQGWPCCETKQVQVMLLGTFHMANPGQDKINIEADDVLVPERQRELRDLADRLEPWTPDRIAVEYPYDQQSELDSWYSEYRTDGIEERNEIVQVGFRLAERLGHERVYGVDDPISIAVDSEAPWNDGFDVDRKLDYPRPDPVQVEQTEQERLLDSTISEFLRWSNQEPRLRDNHDSMFGDVIPWGAGEKSEGARLLGGWHERNARIVQNVWTIVESVDERVLLPVGSGHVRVLRYLLDESPMFCPVSPLPFLSNHDI